MPPAKGAASALARASLVLAPIERGVSTKAQQVDDTVTLLDTRAPWLPWVFLMQCAWRHQALSERGARLVGARLAGAAWASLWSLTRAELLSGFREAAARLEVLWPCRALHALRQGGASRGAAGGLRSLPEIVARPLAYDGRSEGLREASAAAAGPP